MLGLGAVDLKNAEFSAKVSSALVFPALYFSSVFVNQPAELLVLLGQVLGWIALAASFLLIYQTLSKPYLAFILYSGLFLFKFLLLIDSSEHWIFLYALFQNFIYILVGCIVISNFSELIYKETFTICFVNFIIMLLQVLGVASWTQALTTHGEENGSDPVGTLFVQDELLEFSLIQFRPAGISHSTVILTLLISYLITTYYFRKKDKIYVASFFICAIVVLAMGKGTFIALIISIIIALFIGGQYQRKSALLMMATLPFVTFVYSIFFPGLFSYLISGNNIFVSFTQRLSEILFIIAPDSEIMSNEFTKAYKNLALGQDEFVSGYSAILSNPAFLLLISLAGLIYFILAKKLINNYEINKLPLIICLIYMLALPFMHPYFNYQLYWFISGGAFLPFLYPFFKLSNSNKSLR